MALKKKKNGSYLMSTMIALALSFIACGGGGANNDGGGDKVGVASVSLNKSALALNVNGAEQLTATIQPGNAANKNVTWSSSNTAIADVSGNGLNGLVTGKAAGGPVTITVTTQDGAWFDTCAVTVTDTAPAGPDVYVAGVVQGAATLWKNGIPQHLPGGTYANSVFVSGNDVYAAGYDGYVGDNTATAIFWKNGVPQILPGGTSANSVYVSGNDVYVAGDDRYVGDDGYLHFDTAILWKNGVPQILPGGTSANSVFVFRNDVYVAGDGFVEHEDGFVSDVGMLWKNGVASIAENSIEAHSVFVTNSGDVYVSGAVVDWDWDDDKVYIRPMVWKNGVALYQSLSTGDYHWETAYSVHVSGNDVYVAGEAAYLTTSAYERKAKLWKNGVLLQLEVTEANKLNGAYSVFVSGEDVYAAGFDGTRAAGQTGIYPQAVLWKNGVRQSLSDNSIAYSVFVK